MSDFFANKRKLEKSGILSAFTPSTPIDSNLFCGRETETNLILEALTSHGRHIILYGDRGVGKTSLALHCCKLCANNGKKIVRVSCNSNTTFSSEMSNIFEELKIPIEAENTTTHTLGVDVKAIKTEIEHSTRNTIFSAISDPNWVAKSLSYLNCVIFIDEFDMIQDKNETKKFSQLMKTMSDQGCTSHVFLVGIALTINGLLEGHKSIDRCLTQVCLQRMSNAELYEILQKGEERSGIVFEQEVKDIIVKKSLGFPYFTHSLALESASNAILDDRKNVTMLDFDFGLQKTISSVDTSLSAKYNEATKNSEAKRKILYSAAIMGSRGEFKMKDWIQQYHEDYNVDIQNVTINSAMQKIISTEHSGMIQSIRRGVYIFSDSRMPCYIALLGKPE